MIIRIAIAEDHELVRKGLLLLLENIHHFKVIAEASNGHELLNMLHDLPEKPHLALIDVHMPVMDGRETVKVIKERFPEIKLVALSVNTDMETIRDLIREGANAYLFKDSTPDTFKKVLIEVHEKGFYYSKEVIESLMDSRLNNKSTHESEKVNKILNGLTKREIEFIIACCSEKTYKEIADGMGISLRTVDGYRDSIFGKLGVKSRTGIVLFAFNTGLVCNINHP